LVRSKCYRIAATASVEFNVGVDNQLKTEVLEVGYADSNPTEDRLARFKRLASLQISRVESFNRWAKERELTAEQKEIAQQSWNAAWATTKADESFEILKRLAVFDESFRLPALEPTLPDQIEAKFAKLMLAVSLLTLTIQRDYESAGTESEEPWLHSSKLLM
jgi:hypothetical protein